MWKIKSIQIFQFKPFKAGKERTCEQFLLLPRKAKINQLLIFLQNWAIELTNDGSSTYVCKIHRPDGKSYLFFQEFELTVEGAQMQNDVKVIVS